MVNTYYNKWSTILSEYKGYDGTVDEFCKLYNIGKSSLYKVLKEFRDNDIKIEGIKVIEIKLMILMPLLLIQKIFILITKL